MKWARLRLVVALAAFLAWMAYLGYAAATKNRGPVVSRALVAAATRLVAAEVVTGPDGKPARHVKGTMVDDGPFEADVINLPDAAGYAGEGKYLLLLEPAGLAYRLVAPPRSPGYDHPGDGKPVIYPWTPAVQSQLAHLRK